MPRNRMPEYEYEGEFENEFEGEFENEYEGEFENEYENEYEGEFENEYEGEGEFEYEGEGEYENEGEAFSLAGLLRKVAPVALRTLSSALGLAESEYEGEFENEYESEYEAEFESEGFLGNLASLASYSNREAEAEAYAGALAATSLPLQSPAIRKLSPHLIKGSAALTRTLRKSPKSSGLVKLLPTILKRVSKKLLHLSAQGKRLTPTIAGHIMMKETQKILGSPHHAAQALGVSSYPDSSNDTTPRRRRGSTSASTTAPYSRREPAYR